MYSDLLDRTITEVLDGVANRSFGAERDIPRGRTESTKLGRAAQKTFVDNPAVLNLTAAEEQNA